MTEQILAEAMDRHVGDRVEVVEQKPVELEELTLEIGLQRRLRRRKEGAGGIVDQVELQPAPRSAVADRVESLDPLDRFVEHPPTPLTVGEVLGIVGEGAYHLHPVPGEELRLERQHEQPLQL